MTRTELAAQTGFLGPLIVEYRDGRTWIVREEFIFCSTNPAVGCVHVPQRFETDFASIPRFFWRVLHPTHAHIGKAAVIHDLLYRSPAIPITRLEADQVLIEGMRVLGAPAWIRTAVYLAVRFGGRQAFTLRHLP